MAGRRGNNRWIVGALIGTVAGVTAALVVKQRRARREQRRELRTQGRLPRVVILGGGLGGVFCALGLKDAAVQMTVVDRVDHYLYQGMLYQLATGRMDEADVAMPLRERLSAAAEAEFLLGEVDGIDLERHEIHFGDRPHTVLYDHLVIATGVEPAYFGHDEWAQYTWPLKTLRDASELRERILSVFEEAERLDNPAHHRDLTTFVLVGGGPTGVEMAGALAEMVQTMSRRDFQRFDPASTRIVLVEGMDRLLPMFSPASSESARKRLEQFGVEVLTGKPVAKIDAGGVTLADGTHVGSRTAIWTAGVRATPLGAIAGLRTDALGRIFVEPDLTVPGHPEVSAVGDVAHVERNGRPLPAVAPVAQQEGAYVAKRIKQHTLGGWKLPPFHYTDYGVVATVGRRFGVLETLEGRVRFAGLPARLAWTGAHVLLQVPAVDKPVRLARWAWGLVGRRLDGRVIVGPDSHEERVSEEAAKERQEEPTLPMW